MVAARAIRLAALLASACLAPSAALSGAPGDAAASIEIDRTPLDRSAREQTVSYASAIEAARGSLVILRSAPGSILGLGVVVSEDGYAFASAAALGQLDTVEARFADGATRDAKVVGSDSELGVAVLKIDAMGLPAIVVGDSSGLKMGDVVLAFGSLDESGREIAVAIGVVSALPAQDESLNSLWTDANAGRAAAGGALIDAKGRLVGIALPTGDGILQPAIPIDAAHAFLAGLARSQEQPAGADAAPRGLGRFLKGVVAAPVDEALRSRFDLPASARGIVVTEVSPESAYVSALPVGIVISAVNGSEVASMDDAAAALAPGKNVLRIAYRGVSRWIVVDVPEDAGAP